MVKITIVNNFNFSDSIKVSVDDSLIFDGKAKVDTSALTRITLSFYIKKSNIVFKATLNNNHKCQYECFNCLNQNTELVLKKIDSEDIVFINQKKYK